MIKAIEAIGGLTASRSENVMRNDSMLGLLRAVSRSMAWVALLMGVLMVLNTLLMAVLERTREIGILTAIGWSTKRITGAIVIEGFILSAIGSAVGVAVGVLGSHLLSSIPAIGRFVTVSPTPGLVVATALAATALGILGSLSGVARDAPEPRHRPWPRLNLRPRDDAMSAATMSGVAFRPLADPMNERLLPGNRCRLGFWVSNDDRRDGNRVVAAKLKRSLPFGCPKPRLGKADPASAKPRSIGSEHQVLCCERAVFDRVGASFARGDHDQAGRVIEEVELRIA